MTQQPPTAHDTPQHQQEQRSQNDSATTTPPPTRERRMMVMVTIALAALLFLLASGVLYVRWATMREPTCLLVVEAPTALRGAEVKVDDPRLVQPHVVTIGVGERFAIPFYLDYGRYSVRVTLKDATVLDTLVELTPDAPAKKIDLSQFPLPPAHSVTTTAPTPPLPREVLP